MQMYNPEYFSMRDLLKYPERASPDYFTAGTRTQTS